MLRAVLLLLCIIPFTLAQFGGFFQHGFPFGGHGPQHHGDNNNGIKREHKGWHEMDSVHCRAGYVCPSSLACVPTPADCPCPYPEDIKCVIPDNRERDEGEGPPFICVRSTGGQGNCDRVIELSKPI
ncbi:uncharacterized protein I206_101636 [Kwoniella pini CBS 10737]|uniref:Long chronological lifespan protein 2 n=1 Tax=Kwoniella pini CBS 10737 TaxID=1296096 RepID=A0A1B9HW49_9TREE|nr:uncharacterized protein I206_06394 [Kwoniella pini CBS 10737]OCF47493.1 hypothetical protein I206_06394 [Kwoniella pini CBS 10737]